MVVVVNEAWDGTLHSETYLYDVRILAKDGEGRRAPICAGSYDWSFQKISTKKRGVPSYHSGPIPDQELNVMASTIVGEGSRNPAFTSDYIY